MNRGGESARESGQEHMMNSVRETVRGSLQAEESGPGKQTTEKRKCDRSR